VIARLAAASLAAIATLAAAIDTPQWPPPPGVETRMRELQGIIGAKDATSEQRESAREELSKLLKSPAGQARGKSRDEKPTRPARAAIDPYPSVVKPAQAPVVPAPPVAHVEVVVPPKRLVTPNSGSAVVPSGRFAIDPRTGSVLHETPSGYIDPRTGQFVPR
jgi:hypothetical protein